MMKESLMSLDWNTSRRQGGTEIAEIDRKFYPLLLIAAVTIHNECNVQTTAALPIHLCLKAGGVTTCEKLNRTLGHSQNSSDGISTKYPVFEIMEKSKR
jgi:hypothetical protein